MVREMFKVEPDPWQEEALRAFPHSPRLAMKAAKGPGKTATLAWLGWNFLLTRDHPKGAATSISGDNLRDNLWTEFAKWQSQNEILKAKFEWTKTRISARDHPETWFLSARTWPKTADATQQADTLAGIHADYVLFLIDECGGVPDAIMPTAEAALTGGTLEAHIVMAGNPIMLSGPLYRACTVAKHLWKIIEITGDPDDPKRSPRISVEHAREQIKQYGAENPWILVNIFGRFPPSSLNVLIGPDEVADAMRRFHRPYEIGHGTPKALGVDVARFGDDASVIAKRQGIQMFPFQNRRNIDSVQGAAWVAREWDDWNADACFIDMTGGFGAGWFDQLRLLGKTAIGVQYAGEPHNKSRYANKRAEMIFEFVDWIKHGGGLPENSNLLAGLTQTTYAFDRAGRLLVEPKEDVKAKIGFSPDEMDAAIETFAEPIAAPRRMMRPRQSAVTETYDPFKDLDLEKSVQRSYGSQHRSDYDPFGSA